MRRTVRRQNVGVALFPFLAVLICTMGSLIVLLVLLVQQARVDARSIAAEKANPPPATPEELQRQQQELEEAQWRRELLEQSREEKTQELAEARAKLAHMEDHIQRLAIQARELLERAKRIDDGQQLREGELTAAQAELARLNAEIARKQQEVDKARRDLESREKWYALIPYEGPHGTRRRPIYIECTAEGIILQPEGLVLLAGDFDGPLGPGNPLDAALRTIREHLSQTTAGKAGEPYPLLVVRPSGVHAYGAARAALKSWDDEFGYELVSDDKKIAFGSPDPVLAASLERSVAIARQRQAMMASMMPRRYQNEQPLKSFAPDSASSSPSSSAKAPSGRFVGGSGAGGQGVEGESFSTQPPRAGGVAGGGPGRGSASGSPAASGFGPYGSASQNLAATGAGGSSGAGAGTNPGAAPGQQFAAAGQGTSPGGSPGGNAASGGPMGQAGNPPSDASMNPAGGVATTKVQFGQQANSQGGNSRQAPRGGKVASGASRGNNWGLPGAGRHATAITRPLRVAVLLDRIVLVPERGDDRLPQHLRISDELTPQQVDAFVSAVQREMKSWGLAVENGYWKPVLQIEVAPDSEHHFADLQTALESSGFEIERK